MFSDLPAAKVAIIDTFLIPLIFFVMIAIGRWLKRVQGVRLGLSYLLFSIAVAFYLPLVLLGPQLLSSSESPVAAPTPATPQIQSLQKQLGEIAKQLETLTAAGQPAPPPIAAPRLSLLGAASARHDLLRHLGATVTLLGTLVVLALIRRYYWEHWFEKKHKTPAPKFLSQIFGIFVFTSVVILIASLAYGKDPSAILFGSTVVVGIIGFAMQDLLGNIIAGIALEIGKPFKIGDWLVIDGQRAEVIEVNWRSTRLRNNDAVCLDIPNKTIAGAPLTNLTPSYKQHASRLRVHFEYATAPNLIRDCLIRATKSAKGVLENPAPKVYLLDFADSAIVYEVKFWLEDEALFNDTCDAIRTNIWYQAQRHQLRMPFPIRTLQIDRRIPIQDNTIEVVRSTLRKQPFFETLTEPQALCLLKQTRLLRFGREETIIQQGESGTSMFILLRGKADVVVNQDGQQTHLATLGATEYFGEMSLLTGEPRSATVIARSDCELWEIQKSVLGEILQQNQDLVERLGELLTKRKMQTEGILAASTAKHEIAAIENRYRASIIGKLYSFFEL